MHAAIIAIGDELTLGQKLDTNSAWLADRLLALGVTTVEHRTVDDERARLARAIGDLAARCEVLILTGGLGPTDDDLTRDALADALCPNAGMITDESTLRWLERLFADRPGGMPAGNRQQAERPACMTMIPNAKGTAPGLRGRLEACHVFSLPGPPREMRPMFEAHVAPLVGEHADGTGIATALVHAFGLGESAAAERLGKLTDRSRNPLVGTTASSGVVTARIRAHGDAAQMTKEVESVACAVESAWAPYAFGRGVATLAESVGALLDAGGLRLATAESCTGGWVGKAIVDVPGSSDYYRGGWIAYDNAFKTEHLGVPVELLDMHGAVSAPVAEAMGRGAVARAGVDRAIAVTGVAGPGGTESKPAGTVFIAIGRADGETSVHRFHLRGERVAVRERTVRSALQLLRFDLLGTSAPLLWETELDAIRSSG